MAKSGANNSVGKLSTEVLVDSESTSDYNERIGVILRSLIDARLEYKGQETGKLYIWSKAGSTVEVDALDSEHLLAKRIGGRQCCGSSTSGNKVFEIVNGGI